MSGAKEIAAAARTVDGVADLHGGQFGEIATYLPGERVTGVLLRPDSGEVHIVADLSRNVRITGDEVRAVVEAIAGVPMIVTVEDVR